MPPKIPTSFVPHPQFTPQTARPQKSGRNLFLLAALAVLVLALVATALTFAYEKYLEATRNAKEQTVANEEKEIDQSTVAQFVALSSRLAAGNTILHGRIVNSQFFDLLEKITLQNVSLESISLETADDRTGNLSIAGTARDFNALAAESCAFAQQTLIKHAIFSGLNAAKNGTVAFTVTATVDPMLLESNPSLASTTIPSSVTNCSGGAGSAAPTPVPVTASVAPAAPATTTAKAATTTP